jgi:tRNA(adenine34) deaminase
MMAKLENKLELLTAKAAQETLDLVKSENPDLKYMKMALEEAKKAGELGEIPIGAVLVYEGKVIARAHNMREDWQDATAHAEVIVIRNACEKLKKWRLTGATLYVTIEPCPMCAGAIVMSRISRLVYGSEDSKAGACGSLFNIVNNEGLNHEVETVCGVCSEECRDLMKNFFKKRRAVNKKKKKLLNLKNNS